MRNDSDLLLDILDAIEAIERYSSYGKERYESDELLILNALHTERRITTPKAGHLIQKGVSAARATLERLIERGLVQGIGEKSGGHYVLLPHVYKRQNESSQYVRAKGFDRIQQEQMIITWLKVHPRITRSDVIELCGLSKGQASRL